MSMDMTMNKLYKGEWNEISKWYNDEEDKIINLICEPYEPLLLVNRLILQRIEKNEKVLYVSKYKKDIKGLESYKGIVDYVNFNDVYKIKDLYNLIVIDDISFYSNKSEIELMENISFLIKKCYKLVLCSISNVVNNVRSIELSDIEKENHFIEPRVMATRLDLTSSMPYILYDYLKWFNKEKRNVIVYVPNKKKGTEIYNYYIETLTMNKDLYVVQSEDKELLNDVERLKFKDKSCIIITNKLHNYLDYISDIDLIFYFADEKFFDYKKIIFACAALTKDSSVTRELILLCNEETNNIEQAKGLARKYNKFIWERESTKY